MSGRGVLRRGVWEVGGHCVTIFRNVHTHWTWIFFVPDCENFCTRRHLSLGGSCGDVLTTCNEDPPKSRERHDFQTNPSQHWIWLGLLTPSVCGKLNVVSDVIHDVRGLKRESIFRKSSWHTFDTVTLVNGDCHRRLPWYLLHWSCYCVGGRR
jgi:hypothetical protein